LRRRVTTKNEAWRIRPATRTRRNSQHVRRIFAIRLFSTRSPSASTPPPGTRSHWCPTPSAANNTIWARRAEPAARNDGDRSQRFSTARPHRESSYPSQRHKPTSGSPLDGCMPTSGLPMWSLMPFQGSGLRCRHRHNPAACLTLVSRSSQSFSARYLSESGEERRHGQGDAVDRAWAVWLCTSPGSSGCPQPPPARP
jgi:hypothetical protein